jgi:hypothetical protein
MAADRRQRSLPVRVFERSLTGRALCADGEPLLCGCPAARAQPVIADVACDVLRTVLLGFSQDGERLISYSHAPCAWRPTAGTSADVSVWGQCWSFSPGEPLVLLSESPLFDLPHELHDVTPSEMRISCFEAAAGSILVYHVAYHFVSSDAAGAVGAGPRQFESVCVVFGDGAWPTPDGAHCASHRACQQQSHGCALSVDRCASVENVEVHGPFLPRSWSLQYFPSVGMLVWNVGNGLYRLELGCTDSNSTPRSVAAARHIGKGCWSLQSPMSPTRACKAALRCSYFDIERWLPAILSRLQLTHLTAHDYSLLPVGEGQDEAGKEVLLMLLYLQLHTKSDHESEQPSDATPPTPDIGTAPLPPSARRTALCVVLSAALGEAGALRVLHAERAPLEAPMRWLNSKLHMMQRELPPVRASARGAHVGHAPSGDVAVLSNASVASGKSLASLEHPTMPIAVSGFRRKKASRSPSLPRGEAGMQGGSCTQS